MLISPRPCLLRERSIMKKKVKKVKPLAEKPKFDVILPSGSVFSYPDITTFDFTALEVLHNSKRFLTLSLSSDVKFSVLEHMALCAMMTQLYCRFMATEYRRGDEQFAKLYGDPTFVLTLHQYVLSHDVEEIVFGDIPSPVRIPQLSRVKNEVRERLMKFFGYSATKSAAILASTKHVDTVAAFVELYIYSKHLDVKRQRRMFEYYKSRIEKYRIQGFLDYLSKDMRKFYDAV